MSDFSIFIVGVIVTLITGMGVITSQIFIGYSHNLSSSINQKSREAQPEWNFVSKTK